MTREEVEHAMAVAMLGGEAVVCRTHWSEQPYEKILCPCCGRDSETGLPSGWGPNCEECGLVGIKYADEVCWYMRSFWVVSFG